MSALTSPYQAALAGERRWAAAVHIGVLALALLTSWAAGLAGMIGAAAVIFLRPMNSEFVVQHAKEAFNFNLSLLLYLVIGTAVGVIVGVLTLGLGFIVIVPVAIVLAVIMAVLWLICSIVAAMQAMDGVIYRYPFTWRVWR